MTESFFLRKWQLNMSADHHVSRKNEQMEMSKACMWYWEEKLRRISIIVAPRVCLNLTRDKLVCVSWQGLSSFSTFNTLSCQTTLYRPVLHIANSVISEHLLQIRKITQMLLMEKLKRSQYVCLCFYFICCQSLGLQEQGAKCSQGLLSVVCSLQVDPSLKLASFWDFFPGLYSFCVQFILPSNSLHVFCECNKKPMK